MGDKIKLLHIIGSLGVGGCETQLVDLCRRMDKAKFEISLIWYSLTPDCLVDEFNKAGIKTFFIDNDGILTCRFKIINFQKNILNKNEVENMTRVLEKNTNDYLDFFFLVDFLGLVCFLGLGVFFFVTVTNPARTISATAWLYLTSALVCLALSLSFFGIFFR